MTDKPRWQYRFENYRRAFALLQEAVERINDGEQDQLAREGAVGRFGFTWGLAWKMLKDYLQEQGVDIPEITPAHVIREALAADLITNGETWMEALETRNKLSHQYSDDEFEEALESICDKYIYCLTDLHETFSARYEKSK